MAVGPADQPPLATLAQSRRECGARGIAAATASSYSGGMWAGGWSRIARWGRWELPLVALGAAALVIGLALVLSPMLRGGVGQWLDSTANRTCAERALVEHVVDGDTLVVAGDRTIRLLAIDAPETVNPNLSAPQAHGQEAAARLTELVAGRQVCLERDLSDTDHYGRLLRHVWLGQTLVAEVLVREGLAWAGNVPPDMRYEDRLRAAEDDARRAGRGVWVRPPSTPLAVGDGSGEAGKWYDGRDGSFSRDGRDGTGQGLAGGTLPGDGHDAAPGPASPPPGTPAPCGARMAGAIPAESAADFVGTFQAVEFRVVRTSDTGRVTFLNSHDPYQGHFYVAIFPGDYGEFPAPPAIHFQSKCIVVQGSIELYRGTPQIVLRSAADVRLVED